MLVVVENDLPPAVRGRMKLWFIEPRPNVFISGIKDSVASKVVDYLQSHCPPESGVTIFLSSTTTPGYEVRSIGATRKAMTTIGGLQLVVESLKHD